MAHAAGVSPEAKGRTAILDLPLAQPFPLKGRTQEVDMEIKYNITDVCAAFTIQKVTCSLPGPYTFLCVQGRMMLFSTEKEKKYVTEVTMRIFLQVK